MIGKEVRNGNNTYHILQYVGRGRQSEVFKARLMESGQIVAVKHLIKPASAHRFRREASILARLNDPCVVHFVDFFEIYGFGNQEAFLVMDFLPGMPGGSLCDAIKRAGSVLLPLRETLLAFARFAHGLSVLHSHGIIHRNIKPANLYYPTGRPDAVAIMDLGIARDVNGTQTLGKVLGTLDYMPPEVVTTSNRGGPGMDLYALGLSLYVALTGKTAYPLLPQGSAGDAAFYERVRSQTLLTFDSPVVTSRPKLLQLLKDMTNIDPEKRIRDAAEVERRVGELLSEENKR